MQLKTTLQILFLILITHTLYAGGVRGTVKNDKGEVMPFASVLVRGTEIGTMANAEGKFEVKLNAGKYELFFQFVGYQAVSKTIEVGEVFLDLEIVMRETVIQLGEAQVKNTKEDPALTIMRKTIAMSPIHFKEKESYSYRSYLKGAFRIDDIPFIFEKLAKKNYINEGQTYVLEGVNEVKFKQPNSTTTKVISIRSNFPPTMKGSESISMDLDFYNPNNKTSPITAKGAANYRYSYLGFFEDKGLTINRIKIVPKIKSQGYYSGTINIIEGSWYLHSMDLYEKNDEGDSKIKIIFAPIEDIWVLVQYKEDATIDFMGAEGVVNMVASLKNYQITKNPKYANIKPEIIDDKIFKAEAKELNTKKN